MAREHEQGKHPDPVLALGDLAVGKPADMTTQQLAGGPERLLDVVERQAADEEDVTRCCRAHCAPFEG